MSELSIQLAVAAATLIPLLGVYWIGRLVARRKISRTLRSVRPWQALTLQAWIERGWLDAELVRALPPELTPATVLYEWARVDPAVTRWWRFREPVKPETPFEAVVRDLWRNLPAAEQQRARGVLATEVTQATDWWGGAERGWNGRPLSLLGSSVSKKQQGLPVVTMDDLTAAPLAGPIKGAAMAETAEGVDLVLALVALRQSRPRFMHPLAPRTNPAGSLIEGMSTQVASDLGRRLGAGLGAVLGPIGSLVGQHVGGMVGAMGGKALVQQSLPERITEALKETEVALSRLGKIAETDDFARAARQPADVILELGKQLELVREARSRRFRERIWPTSGLQALEVVLYVALADMKGYRAAAELFIATARKSPEPVAGGMVLQNPWLVRSIPGSVEKLNAARATLNRAAVAIRGNDSVAR